MKDRDGTPGSSGSGSLSFGATPEPVASGRPPFAAGDISSSGDPDPGRPLQAPDTTGPPPTTHRSGESAPETPREVDQAADREWMEVALEQARTARDLGEVPVGAVIIHGDRPIGVGHNLTATSNDPSAHAEMVAIRHAAAHLGHWRLLDCTLYVTLEPCTMCAGAIVLARIPRLVFGAMDPKAGMCGSLGNLVQDPRLNHRVLLTTGVGAAESADLLRAFFRARRGARMPGDGG